MLTSTPTRLSQKQKILLIIALVFSLGFVLIFALPYLMFEPSKMERFLGREFWIVGHVATGIVALLVGPVQFWLGWKSRFITHKKLGWVYLIAVALSSFFSFYLAFTTDISWIFGLGLGGLGIAWILTTGFAFIAIRKKNIQLHKEWMTRSYIVTMGFLFFRLFVGITSALGIGTLVQRLEGASWFCWAFPLLFGEIIVQWKYLMKK